jgi:hypothetical protein
VSGEYEMLRDWIARYEQAWRTEGTDSLASLFTADARYSMGPYEPVHRGLEAIAELWEAERASADEPFTMSSEIVAVDGSVGVARVEVSYGAPRAQEYRDIWIIQLDADGRCTSFEEWPFWPEQPRVAGSS